MIGSAALLAWLLTACGGGTNTNVNVTASNSNAVKTNVIPAAPSATPATPAASNTNTAATPAKPAKGDASEVDGELQVGKTESVILYVGMESGDYAAYCFANDSDAGKAIMAACKDHDQCKVDGTVDHESACKVPGLEADLSDSGRITAVKSAKSLGKKKK